MAGRGRVRCKVEGEGRGEGGPVGIPGRKNGWSIFDAWHCTASTFMSSNTVVKMVTQEHCTTALDKQATHFSLSRTEYNNKKIIFAIKTY